MVGQVGYCRHGRAKDFSFLVQHMFIFIPMKGHSKICVVAFLSSLDPPLCPALRAARTRICSFCCCVWNSIAVKSRFCFSRCCMRMFLSAILSVKVENGFRQELQVSRGAGICRQPEGFRLGMCANDKRVYHVYATNNVSAWSQAAIRVVAQCHWRAAAGPPPCKRGTHAVKTCARYWYR